MAPKESKSIKEILLRFKANDYKVDIQFWPRVVTVTNRRNEQVTHNSLVEAYNFHFNDNMKHY
jgi:hypothetical protein